MTTGKAKMSEREKYAARKLQRCSFLPGSKEKRFVRAMEILSRTEDPRISVKQRAELWRLVWRYRRQIPDGRLIAEANHIANGAAILYEAEHD